MGRKRNSVIKDENGATKRKREVVIKTDSVIELVNRLSSELSKKVAMGSIMVNYEGKENMDELIPHLVHSVSVDSQLVSQIQQSLGVEVYPNSYEDWCNSIDAIESEIYLIHANNNNNEESVHLPTVPSSAELSKTASGSGKDRCATDSGNSSLNSEIFGVADLSYTEMDIDALFMDILASSNNIVLDGDKVYGDLSTSLPPLPLNLVGQTLDFKPFIKEDCKSVVGSEVLLTKAALNVENINVDQETSKISPQTAISDVNIAGSSQTSTTSLIYPTEVKSNCSVTIKNSNIPGPKSKMGFKRCTVDIKRVNNPLAVVRESSLNKGKEIAVETVNPVQQCNKGGALEISLDTVEKDITIKSATTKLESEQKSPLVQNCTKVNDSITEKVIVKNPSPPKTRSRSKIVSTEAEILAVIDLVDSDAENKSTEEEEAESEEEEPNNNAIENEAAEPDNNNSSDIWQPSVVLERIDSSKLAQKKTKKVTPHQVRRCIANMKNYVKVEKPDIPKINEAMETTFAWRRKMVIDPDISVHAVLKEFPALSLFEVVKCECDRLLGDKLEMLESLLEENFVRAANSRKIKSPHKLFVDARKAFRQGDSPQLRKISGMVCLAFYLAEKQAVGSLFQLQTKKKRVVKKLTPMMILEEEDLFTENREIRIFADGTEMLKVPNFYEGVLTIYSLYYVLDIVYDKNVTLLFQYFDFLIGLPQSSFSTQPE